jgi:hypothetical protein
MGPGRASARTHRPAGARTQAPAGRKQKGQIGQSGGPGADGPTTQELWEDHPVGELQDIELTDPIEQ